MYRYGVNNYVTNKIYILSVLFIFLLSGCSTKVYYSQEIDLTLKDAKTKQPIENVGLNYWVMLNNQYIERLSDENGKIYSDAISKRMWYFFPFSMITYQDLPPETSYSFTHKEYGMYDMYCIFNPDKKDICYPKIKKINIFGEKNKYIIFISTKKIKLEEECTYKKVFGVVDDNFMIVVDKKHFKDNHERQYEYHGTLGRNEDPRNKNVELGILINGKCNEYRILSIQK